MREKAIEVVKKKDYALNSLAVRNFCEFAGYRESEFYNIVDRL